MQRFGTEHGPLFNATNKHDDPAHALSSFRVAWLRRAPCTFHPDSLNSRIGTLRSVFRPEYGRFPPRSYAPPAPTSRLFKGCSALGGEFSNCNYRCRKGGSKFFNSLLLKYVFAAPCPAFRRRYVSRKPPFAVQVDEWIEGDGRFRSCRPVAGRGRCSFGLSATSSRLVAAGADWALHSRGDGASLLE